MATYEALVTKLLKFTEKIPFAEATTEQKEQALRDVCDAVRAVWNHDEFSYKTVIKRGFVYPVVTNPATPGKGTPLPANFMSFQITGKVYIDDGEPHDKLEYLPYHQIIERTEGRLSNSVGIPTHYGYGGPSDGTENLAINQREILLWPTPNTATILLKLVYQLRCPPDIEDTTAMAVQIPRIPDTWDIPVILAVARYLRRADKGADTSELQKFISTAIKQMQVNEPHGREKPARRQLNPAWRR